MAVRELKRDTAVTADILLSQVDHVTGLARMLPLSRPDGGPPVRRYSRKNYGNRCVYAYIRSTG